MRSIRKGVLDLRPSGTPDSQSRNPFRAGFKEKIRNTQNHSPFLFTKGHRETNETERD
jgi:hypothetical protein